MRHWIALVVIAAAGSAHAGDLEMQDLKALETQKQWSELLDRADQVKPASRDATWKRLVTSAATHVVEGAGGATTLATARDLVDRVPPAERKYPFVRDDAGYRAAKAKAIDVVVAMCKHDDARGCGVLVEALAAGVDKFSKGTARQIAVMVGTDIGAADAIHYWTLAVADDASACKDIAVERSVIATFSAGGDHVAEAQKTATTCIANLEKALTDALVDAEEKSPYTVNACPVLKPRGAMTVLKKKKCT